MSDVTPHSAGGHVLVLGSGSNILGLMAAPLGARRVTCVERGPLLLRMAKQTLQSNQHIKGAGKVTLVDRQLQACGVTGERHLLRYHAFDVQWRS